MTSEAAAAVVWLAFNGGHGGNCVVCEERPGEKVMKTLCRRCWLSAETQPDGPLSTALSFDEVATWVERRRADLARKKAA